MRPAGEIRAALRGWSPEAQPVTWRDALAYLACVGLVSASAPAEVRLVRQTVENMARSSELLEAGYVRAPGSRRPMAGYLLPSAAQQQADRSERAGEAAELLACWWGRAAGPRDGVPSG